MKIIKSVGKGQAFFLFLFPVGAVGMILHSVLGFFHIDANTYSLGLAFMVVSIVPLYTSKQNSRREAHEVEIVQTLKDIKASLDKSLPGATDR